MRRPCYASTMAHDLPSYITHVDEVAPAGAGVVHAEYEAHFARDRPKEFSAP